MVSRPIGEQAEPMVDIIVLACTAVAFLAIIAAVPIELNEERRDEHEARPDR